MQDIYLQTELSDIIWIYLIHFHFSYAVILDDARKSFLNIWSTHDQQAFPSLRHFYNEFFWDVSDLHNLAQST